VIIIIIRRIRGRSIKNVGKNIFKEFLIKKKK